MSRTFHHSSTLVLDVRAQMTANQIVERREQANEVIPPVGFRMVADTTHKAPPVGDGV